MREAGAAARSILPPVAELMGTAGLVSVVTEGFIQLPRRRALWEPAPAAEDQEGKETP